MQPTDDQQRLELLFRDNSQSLLGYLLRRAEDPEDASDALAEVMLVAWRRLDDVPAGDEARLWLFGVARRVLANTRRSTDRRRRLGERLRQELAEAPSPVQVEDDQAATVRAALRRLPETYREVLLLNAWEGLEPSQIAAVIGVVPATARTRLRRARKQLRHELEEMEGDAEAPTASPRSIEERA